uniref:MFS domain-containing protein n=1 Tax=Rhabditophanes sp. KR3021 TaxID=114890 RepID=A0AC35UGD5_9BILA
MTNETGVTLASRNQTNAPLLTSTAATSVLNECEHLPERVTEYRVYSVRWMILAAVALSNFTNAFCWICFASVSTLTNEYFNSENASFYLSYIFIFATIPIALLAIPTSDVIGLKNSIWIAAACNGVGNIIRMASIFTDGYKLPLMYIGTAIAAFAYPWIMFLPPKVSGTWFPTNQRAIATAIGIMANPLGVMMANVISPLVINDPQHVPYIVYIVGIPAVLAMFISFIFVHRNTPAIPPAATSVKTSVPYWEGLKECFSNVQYLVILTVLGGGIGMFNTLYTVMNGMLCSSGYSTTISGTCAALMVTGGIFGSVASGIFVDRTKKFGLTIKVALTMAVIFGIGFVYLAYIPNITPLLILSAIVFGFFGLSAYPTGLELAAECTYPVSEGISAGFIVLAGQIYSVILGFGMNALSTKATGEREHIQTCYAKTTDTLFALDYWYANMFVAGIASSFALICLIFLRPVLKRTMADKLSSPSVVIEEGTPLSETTAIRS